MNRFLLAGLVSCAFVAGWARPSASDVIYSLRYMEPGNKISRVPERRILLSNAARWEENFGWHSWTYLKTVTLTQYDQKRVIALNAHLRMFKIASFDEVKAKEDKGNIEEAAAKAKP